MPFVSRRIHIAAFVSGKRGGRRDRRAERHLHAVRSHRRQQVRAQVMRIDDDDDRGMDVDTEWVHSARRDITGRHATNATQNVSGEPRRDRADVKTQDRGC